MLGEQSKCKALTLVMVIINRGCGEKLSDIFIRHSINFGFLVHGRGTANTKILNYLGLGETEKEVIFSIMPDTLAEVVLEEFNHPESLGMPGKGIAFSLSVDSLLYAHAKRTLKAQVITECDVTEGGNAVHNENEHDLIIAITNVGYSEDVMECAKKAGATGGTILHARGVGQKDAEKFFGISIQSEKEMVLMVVKRTVRDQITDAIAEKMGAKSDAMTLVFSLPVNGVAGLGNALERMDAVPENEE